MIPRLLGRSRAAWSALLLVLAALFAPAPAAASLPSPSHIHADELHVLPSLPQPPLPAPGPFDVRLKTRVRGFDLGLNCFIGTEAGLTCTSRPAYPLQHREHAVARSVFTGYELDRETGLYNAKARYFDPQLGRFLSQDSFLGQIDTPPSLHRYFYANANPTRYVDPTGHASIDTEDLSTNELRSRVAAYDPGTGRVRREEPCGAGNTCIIPRTPDPLVQGALRTAGGDKGGALSLIDGLKATNNRSFAVVVTEDSDYESNGRLDTSKVYRQFLNQVGGHAGVLEGLREEFQAALEGAVPGQARDISFLYNVAYEYSAAKSYALAEQDAQEHFGPDFIQRNAHLLGQWGAAPREVSTSAAVALAADTLTAASAGLGIYRFGAGMVADGAASAAAAPNLGLRELHVGPYEESTARGLGTVRDRLTGDHIPSFAAVRRNVEKQLGRRLTDVEAGALRSKTTTITVHESIHRGQSPTYGARNTPAQIEADSANLAGAAQRDAQALYKAMVKEGSSPTEIQMALEKLHRTNREGGIY